MEKRYPTHFAPRSTIGRFFGTLRFFVAAAVFAGAAHAALLYDIPKRVSLVLGGAGVAAIDALAASAAPDIRDVPPPGAGITLEATTVRATSTAEIITTYPLALPERP